MLLLSSKDHPGRLFTKLEGLPLMIGKDASEIVQ